MSKYILHVSAVFFFGRDGSRPYSKMVNPDRKVEW